MILLILHRALRYYDSFMLKTKSIIKHIFSWSSHTNKAIISKSIQNGLCCLHPTLKPIRQIQAIAFRASQWRGTSTVRRGPLTGNGGEPKLIYDVPIGLLRFNDLNGEILCSFFFCSGGKSITCTCLWEDSSWLV